MTNTTRIIVSTLGLLALFQLSEFTVCGATHWSAALWSRIGFIAITLLPPLGIHLVHVIRGKGQNILVWFAYATGLAFALIFGLSSSAFESHVCAGNYAIFQLANGVGGAYFFYYYGWLFMGIILSYFYGRRAKEPVRRALIYQVFGYLVFLIPTGVVNAVNPQTMEGIPSVMCGFAVLYAIVLAFGITPIVLKRK